MKAASACVSVLLTRAPLQSARVPGATASVPVAKDQRLGLAPRTLLNLAGLIALISVMPACTTLFGVDFDNAFLRAVDGGVEASAVEDAGDPDPVPAAVPKPEAPAPDGSCSDDRKACDGLCVSLLDPTYGCATTSCSPCSIARGDASCNAGGCAVGKCDAERADCNLNPTDGCETNTKTDPAQCGGCGVTCANGLVCSNGACAASCTGDATTCTAACVNLKSNPEHCGGCDKTCSGTTNGVATCAASQCGIACNAGYRACGGGLCKADSVASCGPGCVVCASPTNGVALCASGTCDFVCNKGFVKSGSACVADTVEEGAETLSVGAAHTCAVKTDGSVACWGVNAKFGVVDGRTTPPAGVFKSVSAGATHTCGVKADGSVACWGDDYSGKATPPTGIFKSVAAGVYHTCGVKGDGSVACWGHNANGQATPPTGIFKSTSAGYSSCGVKADGYVVCWGTDLKLSGIFKSISQGSHICGLTPDGVAVCAGAYAAKTQPASTFKSVSAGEKYTCGVKLADASVVCWGKDYRGVTSPPTGTFKSVSAGSYACGVRTDGSVVCWGEVGEMPPPGLVVK